MAISFHSFVLDKLEPELACIWEAVIIQKVEVSSANRCWRIHLQLPLPISAADIQATEIALRRKLPFLDQIDLIPAWLDHERNIKEILHLRQEDWSAGCFADLTAAKALSSIDWQIKNNRIDLVTKQLIHYQELIDDDVCSRLAAWFWQEYRLRPLVRVVCREQRSADSTRLTWIKQQEPEIISAAPDEGRKKRSFGHKKTASSIIKAPSLPISELQEGMKTAVTEGEIWFKETNSLKDGRLVISYYLTDHTDTIIIKTFVDSPQEDKIESGDYIKVKGSIRFDPFSKEPVLYMDSCNKMARSERCDESPQKRIELHAHTKMSAMDGLSEVKGLINKAAAWGHPAIAITDHGCIQAFPLAFAAEQALQDKGKNLKIIYGVEAYLVEEDKKERPYHIILLAKNRNGLKNLYKLISLSYLDHFYRKPKMRRADLECYREGLLLGSACEAGELYQALLNEADEEQLNHIVQFYDYLEIQPLSNNQFLIKEGRFQSETELMDLNRRIITLGEKNHKLVVATGDVHFLEPQDQIYRTIIQAGQGYEDADAQAPLYFKTTQEMLNDFAYLGEDTARRVVIDNPNQIAALIEQLKPVPDGFYPPQIDSAEQEITELTWENAHLRYGEQLPEIVEARLRRELDSITTHGFSVLYLIAHKLVKKSNEDGYLVGSRGSVGSSLVAFLTGITEVNALPPHYLCTGCHYSEFFCNGEVGSGVDLEDRNCPHCGATLYKDGFDIPFETFLGFDGDKTPDIDLNFSGDYQSRAHQYVEELFGSENVFRAGTISTVAEKTAFGFVKKYAEDKQMEIKNSEITRLASGITGVRRTTGQHPGGLIVVPRDHDIMEFTPLQHPADKKESGIITTHFEYHALDQQLIKLDILGHDDPTVIKELEDLTGIQARLISLSEPETMKLFSGVEPLKVKPEDIDSVVGTYGIPEFGTRFVRQMLEATRPTSFSELVRISGLSHGTDVWSHNAQDLIEEKTATLGEVICTRDDIMTYLIQKGLDKKQSFKIMEKVRKGKKLNDEESSLMLKHDIPQWYVDSCKKIEYMFPKAHAVAYVTMAYRIAWFKVYYPLAFYASFFGIRAEDFDAATILSGYDDIRQKIKEIDKMGYGASQKDKKLVTILELAMEMYARGYNFEPVDIYESDARKFVVKGNSLLLPFAALPNIGAAAAQGVVTARADGPFISIEDFQIRTRLNKSAMELLRQANCFADLPEKSQLSLFA
ncbi:MAG: PolC-type DNA polymerase III [Syntrophomonadaceae bacterium]|nr:PolC-type DNA polymerase III [Syntrophomonadaceae bacterium]